MRVESHIEAAYRERLERACYVERVSAARATRGVFGRPRADVAPPPTPACDELVDKFHGGRGRQGAYG